MPQTDERDLAIDLDVLLAGVESRSIQSRPKVKLSALQRDRR